MCRSRWERFDNEPRAADVEPDRAPAGDAHVEHRVLDLREPADAEAEVRALARGGGAKPLPHPVRRARPRRVDVRVGDRAEDRGLERLRALRRRERAGCREEREPREQGRENGPAGKRRAAVGAARLPRHGGFHHVDRRASEAEEPWGEGTESPLWRYRRLRRSPLERAGTRPPMRESRPLRLSWREVRHDTNPFAARGHGASPSRRYCFR